MKAEKLITHIRTRYRNTRLTEVVLLSLAAGVIMGSLAWFLKINDTLVIITAAITTIIAGLVVYRKVQLHQLNDFTIHSFLDQRFPQLENSTDLITKNDDDLTILEKIQKKKIAEHLEAIYPTVSIPHHIGRSAFILVGSCILGAGLLAFRSPTDKNVSITDASTQENSLAEQAKIPTVISNITVTVKPPAYTGKNISQPANLNLSILEGSWVQWKYKFNSNIQKSFLIFSGRDTILAKPGDEFVAARSINQSTFYQLGWVDQEGNINTSDYYKLMVTLDEPPSITIKDLDQFTELDYNSSIPVNIKSNITDDFGLSEAYIIATVSKGSGESVKFREEKMSFLSPPSIKGKSVTASRTVDLVKLGLEPGDELYFYVEAIDNKTPYPNKSRTETYFIELRDTTTQTISMEGGLGVDLMPEYFRSQRQIIIDSEKLLKDQKSISKHDFNFKSNELGYDQKVLRLKYGEFLGEEFETSIGPGADHVDDHGHEEESVEDLSKQFGHVHDTDNEHHLVPEKKAPDHSHTHNNIDPEKPESIMDAYKHVHDDPEEATFFTQSIRTKLKAALTVMWDAELHLRMYDPKSSLPYQYQALKLLKEISNDSRIYVHKTGFDPPPLKEEKRLTGDLTEIKSTTVSKVEMNTNTRSIILQAVDILERKTQMNTVGFSQDDLDILQRAGNELAAIALQQPGKYLEALSSLKSLITSPTENAEIKLRIVRAAFWDAIPKNARQPSALKANRSTLDETFIRTLEANQK